MVTQSLDGIEFTLAESTDLEFIRQYGRVFRVFDDHDSGNISFGIDAGDQKLFIKLAGIATTEAVVSAEAAIANLRAAEAVYRDLKHPHIVELLDVIEHDPWFGLIFAWNEGTLLRRVNQEDFARFRALPLIQRLDALSQVIEVMQHIHNSGYVAIDIYDASFLYDFEQGVLTVCDLDVCARQPFINTMGRLWGSSRFMSPEEYELGATIDEVTNVFTLGAVAHLFLGDERTKLKDDWEAGPALFEVATIATSPERADRYPTIAAFAAAWSQASTR
ncbi:MAG: protein kinase family protein [Thermomicrobiales bacterium]|nr:protein kinase family protein [Thermomicrobiales bacterium]